VRSFAVFAATTLTLVRAQRAKLETLTIPFTTPTPFARAPLAMLHLFAVQLQLLLECLRVSFRDFHLGSFDVFLMAR
jgi:hypothetical protein